MSFVFYDVKWTTKVEQDRQGQAHMSKIIFDIPNQPVQLLFAPQPAAPPPPPECPAGHPPGTTEPLARPPAHAAPAPPRRSWPAAPATVMPEGKNKASVWAG